MLNITYLYIINFALRSSRGFLRKVIFLGGIRVVLDTQTVFLSPFQYGSVLKLKMCILSYTLFLSLLAYSATSNKLALKGMDLFLCISFENTGNESLFVGKDWNSFTELSRDPRKGSVGHDLEVLTGLFVKYLKLKEPQDRKKNKIFRESCRKVIYGTYWMVRSGTQKIIFFPL